jgi:Histidine kinase-, DNA gyrase B-, and HSP90-like ATPase
MTSNASISQGNLMPASRGSKVSIVTGNEERSRLVIEVSHTGIGIRADALSWIFSPPEQGDSSIHRRYGGLGLSIAGTLIKAHGGTLAATSEELNKVAKFTARLEMDDSATEAGEDDRLIAAKEASRHVAGAQISEYGTNYHTKRRPVRSATQTGKKKLSPASSTTYRKRQ